ncbi:MAG: shikimate dehydrogenase [Pyrinomonadaceae bacterium]
MNNGKICVSICVEKANDLEKQLEQAQELADIVELRFDCLNTADLETSLRNLPTASRDKPILHTLRSTEQGGKRILTKEERANFWAIDLDREWADLEEDIIEDSNKWRVEKRICSFHDFSGSSPDLNEVFDRLAATNADVVKIAIEAVDIVDSIPVWKLLERAKNKNRSMIPIAMGEAGKWTRILGLAHGAFMTYASLISGAETAPGQILAADMIDAFKVKELDEQTEVFGIIAGNTSYSVSPWMHNAAFSSAGLNSVFVPLQVADLEAFFTRMVLPGTREVNLNFNGFSVTNPHKQTIIPYLDEVDETAAEIGAVNTVKIMDGKFYGYNTDAPGFIGPLKKVFGDLTDFRVAVFGAGGAARACIFALRREGAVVTVLARNEEKGRTLADEFGIACRSPPTDNHPLAADFDIIVNATPLGTAGPSEELAILETTQLEGIKLVYDLVYNPAETRLMRVAAKAGVSSVGGLEMLIAQGVKQFEIWTGLTAPTAAMKAAVLKRFEL